MPEFDTYPAPRPQELGYSGGRTTETIRPAEISEPERLLPRDAAASNPELERKASKIGGALGRVVSIAKNPKERLRQVSERFGEMKNDLRDRIRDLRSDAGDTAGDWKENARARANMMRHQAVDFTREKPFHVIAGAGIAAFCLGVGLRIWRAAND